jgi:hypothetical protein
MCACACVQDYIQFFTGLTEADGGLQQAADKAMQVFQNNRAAMGVSAMAPISLEQQAEAGPPTVTYTVQSLSFFITLHITPIMIKVSCMVMQPMPAVK